MEVLYLSDGKAGHQSQAAGLIALLERAGLPVRSHTRSIDDLPLTMLLGAFFLPACRRQVDHVLGHGSSIKIILGVGRRTHSRVWLLKKLLATAKAVIIMRPSLPWYFFDLVILPPHDAPELPLKNSNIVVSPGVLNPVTNEQRHEDNRVLVLVGGPSKRYTWDNDRIARQIATIIREAGNQQFVITGSRRTPADFYTAFNTEGLADAHCTVYQVEQTSREWLLEQFQRAGEIWITEDSLSMIYEAINSGARVRLLHLPARVSDRIVRFLANSFPMASNPAEEQEFLTLLKSRLG